MTWKTNLHRPPWQRTCFNRSTCNSPDQRPHAFAALDRQAIAGTPPLQPNRKDFELRQRIRAWALDDELYFPGNLEDCPQVRAGVPANN